MSSGPVTSTADASDAGGVRSSQASNQVEGVDVLLGLITADLLIAASESRQDGSGFAVSDDGTTFANLRVLGVPMGIPAPNTRVELAGIGHVLLNEQVARVNGNSASLTVRMVHVFVTIPNGLVEVGTEIVVAHAATGLQAGIGGTLGGRAYGTSAQQGPAFLSGPSANVALGCLGTKGAVRTNSIAEVILPPLFTVGSVVDTAQGTVTDTSASGETTSTIESIDVVLGTVTATLVKADASVFTDGSTYSLSSEGSMFVDLSVAGFPDIGDDVAPNTSVRIAGLGTLWLYRVIQTGTSTEVRMIELIVTEENVFGIATGTAIRVGVAQVSAR